MSTTFTNTGNFTGNLTGTGTNSANTNTGMATGTGTGSWANSTHSVIWMSRSGKSPAMPNTNQPHAAQYASLTVAALLTIAAASNLIDVYGSALSWTSAAIPATIIGSLVALAGLVPALRLWWQMLFMACAQLVVGPVIFLNGTTIAHVIPTLRTLTQGWMRMLGSFKYLLAIDPPTGTGDGSLLAVWTICLWAALLAGIFAVAEDGRLTMVAVVPVVANLAICALLGTSSGFYRMAIGTIMAVVLVVWVSARWKLLELGRWLSSVVIVLLASAVAIGGCLVVGQNRTILRDHYDPPLSPYDYTSPLSGMRSYIKNHKDDVLLTVDDLPAGSTVRLAVMDRFDGNVWNLSDSTMASDSSNYHRVGDSITNNATGKRFTAKFTVDDGLSDYWLPMAGAASSVKFATSSDADSFYYNTDTMSAIYPSRTSPGLSYTETGVIPRTPTDKEIAKANASSISQPKAEDVPDCVDKLATAIAGGQSKGGEAAQSLADKLRESGWFSHGLNGDYPSRAGHGNYRIDQLLAGSAMVGDSEQYASAMALMARSLGLPSRVVLGFLPKNDEGEISDSRTEKHGKTTTTKFTGNDVTAWVEIKLDGYGWVAFYPTPKETKVPDENQNLTPPNPQTLVRAASRCLLTGSARERQPSQGQTSLAAAWPTRRRRACSGSVSAESSEKSPSTAALCGRCSSSAACCSPSRRSPWLGLAGMAAHRNASLPDGRRSRRLPGKAALTSKAPETSRRRPSPNRWASMPIHCSSWAGRLITRPSPEAMSRRSMRNATGMTSPKNESSCSARCRRSAGGGRNYRLRTCSTSGKSACGKSV